MMPINSPTSCIYSGYIRHRRFAPQLHQFKYSINMLFVDIDKLPDLLNLFPIAHTKLPAFGWFRRSDYHGDKTQSVSSYIRSFIQEKTGNLPGGKIFLLTHLRYWGLMMNPISIFYCYDEDKKQQLNHVVLQVTNTPWKEKILYLLNPKTESNKHHFDFPKEMHVSPFNPMDMEYQCRMNTPTERLLVHLENHKGTTVYTDATLILSLQALSRKSLMLTILKFPHETLKVLFGIYWNAIKLWHKKTPLYTHPKKVNTKK